MRAAQIRAAAIGILVVAVLDLAAMSVFLAFGWIDAAAPDAEWAARMALPGTFLVLALAVLGAVSVLVTTRHDHAADDFAGNCWECGEIPRFEVAFCHQCGAA